VNIDDIHTVELGIPTGKNERSGSIVYFFSFTPLAGIGGEGKSRQFSELSSGCRRIIRLLTSLLFDDRSVMLIEEPEDSIHPGLLRKVIDILRSYSHKCQVIFSTHSADVLNMLKPEEILLATAPKGVTSLKALDIGELQRAHEFLQAAGSLSEFFESFDVGE
jgi:ABC-type multidrug transport system ATPase subunit